MKGLSKIMSIKQSQQQLPSTHESTLVALFPLSFLTILYQLQARDQIK
jgi:hypothetical protein